MAVVDKSKFLEMIKGRIGDDTSDEAMSFIEDMTDTYNDLESRSAGIGDDAWQKKYNDLDTSWREKYKARFFEGAEDAEAEKAKKKQEEDVRRDGNYIDFNDLFKEREGK